MLVRLGILWTTRISVGMSEMILVSISFVQYGHTGFTSSGSEDVQSLGMTRVEPEVSHTILHGETPIFGLDS